ncbi:MAG TPA: SDR family NAD(P)-dependent oxidoreductase [Acidimicrobiales bacterium]|nr:SDR family NAD(P)-dependent oxidoreductase [Acidimicrobiales bacterium]
MEPITFDNQVAVVTGAGGGLGRTYALELARRGAKVVVNDLGGTPDGTGASRAADRVVAEITEAGGEAVASYDSVSTPEGGAEVVQRAIDAFGTVDIVVNNAGFLRDRSFPKLSLEELHGIVEVHLLGAFYVSQPAFRVMKEKGYGRLVFTSSAAGLFGNFGQANYAAAKMGLVGLSNVLALEGATCGVLSNTIAPVAASRLTEELLGDAAELLAPDLVAPMVVYLASKACDVTGEVYSAAGGRFARVFVGLAPGWFAGKGLQPTAEDVAAHIADIRSEDGYAVLTNCFEETALLQKQLS